MNPHYFSERQPAGFKLCRMALSNVRGFSFELFTAPGIFSWRRLDNGTKSLAKYMRISKGDSVLDLGCGTGVLGIVAAKLGADVTMSDINRNAVQVAKMNVKNLNLSAKVVHSDLFSRIPGKFDVILSNPPVSAGLEVCYKLIAGSKDHLNPGGSLQLVARHNIAGRRLMEKMTGTFGNCEVLGKSGGFWVYCSESKK